jgi:hypothetical protein
LHQKGDNVKKRNTGARLSGNERVKMARKCARLYDSGKDIRAVAQQCGISYTLTRTLLAEAGVTMRPVGGWGVTRGATLAVTR